MLLSTTRRVFGKSHMATHDQQKNEKTTETPPSNQFAFCNGNKMEPWKVNIVIGHDACEQMNL